MADPMPTVHALLADIIANPGDHAVRLILADALEEVVTDPEQLTRLDELRADDGWWSATELLDGGWQLYWNTEQGSLQVAGFRHRFRCALCDRFRLPRYVAADADGTAKPLLMMAREDTGWRWTCQRCCDKIVAAKASGLTWDTTRTVYTPATPEQRAADLARTALIHGGTYDIRRRESLGEIGKAEADVLIREARLRRRQRVARLRKERMRP